MAGLTYEQIVEKIKKQANVSEDLINEKVKEKIDKLSNLISKEGAAHIVANEMGVKIFESPKGGRLKIKELQPLQRNIEVLGKVLKQYGVKSYKTSKKEGRLGSFLFADDTGLARVTVWDEPLMPEVEKLQENDLVLVKGAYIRQNNGYNEIHLGFGGQILINPIGENLGETVGIGQKPEAVNKAIVDLAEKDFAAVTGTVVQVFEPHFYEACNVCGKKVNEEGKCKEHGAVEKKTMPVINIIFDDGTENIRIVAFRDKAEAIFGIKAEGLALLKDNFAAFDELRQKVLLKQMRIMGKVVRNEMFDRLEMIASDVAEINAKEALSELKSSEETVS